MDRCGACLRPQRPRMVRRGSHVHHKSTRRCGPDVWRGRRQIPSRVLARPRTGQRLAVRLGTYRPRPVGMEENKTGRWKYLSGPRRFSKPDLPSFDITLSKISGLPASLIQDYPDLLKTLSEGLCRAMLISCGGVGSCSGGDSGAAFSSRLPERLWLSESPEAHQTNQGRAHQDQGRGNGGVRGLSGDEARHLVTAAVVKTPETSQKKLVTGG